jgi:hypothetical protein
VGLTNQPPDLMPGTLDLLILRTLVAGPLHGYGIAERLKVLSQDVLHGGESSLYPAGSFCFSIPTISGAITPTWFRSGLRS